MNGDVGHPTLTCDILRGTTHGEAEAIRDTPITGGAEMTEEDVEVPTPPGLLFHPTR